MQTKGKPASHEPARPSGRRGRREEGEESGTRKKKEKSGQGRHSSRAIIALDDEARAKNRGEATHNRIRTSTPQCFLARGASWRDWWIFHDRAINALSVASRMVFPL